VAVLAEVAAVEEEAEEGAVVETGTAEELVRTRNGSPVPN